MSNHKTFVLNTEDTFEKLQQASEKKAETLFKYRKIQWPENNVTADDSRRYKQISSNNHYR